MKTVPSKCAMWLHTCLTCMVFFSQVSQDLHNLHRGHIEVSPVPDRPPMIEERYCGLVSQSISPNLNLAHLQPDPEVPIAAPLLPRGWARGRAGGGVWGTSGAPLRCAELHALNAAVADWLRQGLASGLGRPYLCCARKQPRYLPAVQFDSRMEVAENQLSLHGKIGRPCTATCP